jgi:hypothetical protein
MAGMTAVYPVAAMTGLQAGNRGMIIAITRIIERTANFLDILILTSGDPGNIGSSGKPCLLLITPETNKSYGDKTK